jgi:hypothetical protein
VSLAVLLLLQVATGQPQTGQDVVARMHDRWQGKWFRTFTFVQRTTFPDKENGKEIQREEYTQLTFDAASDPSVFETGEWKRPGWIRK